MMEFSDLMTVYALIIVIFNLIYFTRRTFSIDIRVNSRLDIIPFYTTHCLITDL